MAKHKTSPTRGGRNGRGLRGEEGRASMKKTRGDKGQEKWEGPFPKTTRNDGQWGKELTATVNSLEQGAKRRSGASPKREHWFRS